MLTYTPALPPPALVLAEKVAEQALPLVYPNEVIEERLHETSSAFVGCDALDREPWFGTYEERLPGGGGVQLRLARWPIVDVQTVEVCGTVLDPSDVLVSGDRRATLYKPSGWPRSRRLPGALANAGNRQLDIRVHYRAGWIPPGDLLTWEAGLEVAAGAWLEAGDRIFEATTGGSTGVGEPVWPARGEAVADGTVTWTATEARPVPPDLRAAALMHTLAQLQRPDLPAHVSRLAMDGVSATIRDDRPFSPAVATILRRWR